MADDVTKKDLQSLQGYVNKQLGDLEKRLKAEINECIKGYESRTNSLLGDINQINTKLAELAKAVEQQPHDLVIVGYRPQEDRSLVEQLLHAGEHHLLLVPRPQPVPTHALICVTAGEPGKDDVLFAGQGENILMHHHVTDRKVFAQGALHAALWLATRPAGFYSMDDVLGTGT